MMRANLTLTLPALCLSFQFTHRVLNLGDIHMSLDGKVWVKSAGSSGL